MEAANRGAPRGRRRLGRARHRAAVRAGPQRLGRHRDQLPLLLRAQDDVRQVRAGVRRPARRLRHAGRAVRGAHAGADRKVTRFPVVLYRHGVLGRPARLDAQHHAGRAARSTRADLDLLHVTDDVDEAVGASSRPRGRRRRRTRRAAVAASLRPLPRSGSDRTAICAARVGHRRSVTDLGRARARQLGRRRRHTLVSGGGRVVDDGRGRRARGRRRTRRRDPAGAGGPGGRRHRRRRAGRHRHDARTQADDGRALDAFLALPGGLGTLEELFEVWTTG